MQFLLFLIVLFLFWHFINLLFLTHPVETVVVLVGAGLLALFDKNNS